MLQLQDTGKPVYKVGQPWPILIIMIMIMIMIMIIIIIIITIIIIRILNIDMYLVYIQVKNVSLNALCELYNAPVNPMKEQASSSSNHVQWTAPFSYS